MNLSLKMVIDGVVYERRYDLKKVTYWLYNGIDDVVRIYPRRKKYKHVIEQLESSYWCTIYNEFKKLQGLAK